MPLTTPFHSRLDPLNETRIWKHWSGYLVAPRYQYSEIAEYYAIRNSVAVLDTSPLFKYRISGGDSEQFLQRAMVRDVGKCKIGQCQYTCWCNEAGFVIQDGVITRIADDEYLLTSAEPSLRYFQILAKQFEFNQVVIEDISKAYGILAVQGPHSRTVLGKLTQSVESLNYFTATRAEIAGCQVTISRTGFTGDLGFEIWIKAGDALKVWDEIFSAGKDYNVSPLGTTALKMARVEAGLLLMDVDFYSARHAWTDEQRETPLELGWGWMLGGLAKDQRAFRGRTAIESERKNKSSRWTTVGLAIDWQSYETAHIESGIMPPKQGVYCETTMSIYRRSNREWDYAGYASSFLFSSLLRKPIAIAKLPLDLASFGTEVDLELTVVRRPKNVLARVVKLPFFNPARKKAMGTAAGKAPSRKGEV